MKKLISFISFVLVLVMLASGATVFGAAFKDFPGESKYNSIGVLEQYVKFEPQCGWKGYPDGTFHPNEKITRAEFVCYLYQFYRNLMERTNCIRIEPIRKYGSGFSDVPAKSWYYESVVWAYERGIVNGVGCGKFDPGSTIDVFEYAIMLKRLYNSAFTREYFEWCLENEYEFCKDTLTLGEHNYPYEGYSYLREEIMQNAILIDMPAWFKRETTVDEILKHDIWIGGGGKQVDMTQFTPTRGELHKHSHDIWDYKTWSS